MNLKDLYDSLQDAVRKHTKEMAKGDFLVPGEVITIHGTNLVIIRHIDEMPVGHYLAAPDLSDCVETEVATLKVVFHPATKNWASSSSMSDLLKAAKDQAQKAGPELQDLRDHLKDQLKGKL